MGQSLYDLLLEQLAALNVPSHIALKALWKTLLSYDLEADVSKFDDGQRLEALDIAIGHIREMIAEALEEPS